MQIPIHSSAELGLVLRAVRRSSKVRLDDFAATAGVSKQFATDVEYGKPTVPLVLDIPQAAEHELAALRLKGGVRSPRQRLGAG